MKTKKAASGKSVKSLKPKVLRDAVTAEWGRVVTVRDAKAHLSGLLEWVAAGNELTITSDGRPKARLVSAGSAKSLKVFTGMGDYLMRQPVHGAPGAGEILRTERDSRP